MDVIKHPKRFLTKLCLFLRFFVISKIASSTPTPVISVAIHVFIIYFIYQFFSVRLFLSGVEAHKIHPIEGMKGRKDSLRNGGSDEEIFNLFDAALSKRRKEANDAIFHEMLMQKNRLQQDKMSTISHFHQRKSRVER